MATVFVRDETRRRLLRIAADLQREQGQRVNFDQVIDHLARKYEEPRRRPELFRQFCGSLRSFSFEEGYRELMRERRRDERKYRS